LRAVGAAMTLNHRTRARNRRTDEHKHEHEQGKLKLRPKAKAKQTMTMEMKMKELITVRRYCISARLQQYLPHHCIHLMRRNARVAYNVYAEYGYVATVLE
jgi:hypothetical protein